MIATLEEFGIVSKYWFEIERAVAIAISDTTEEITHEQTALPLLELLSRKLPENEQKATNLVNNRARSQRVAYSLRPGVSRVLS